MKSLKVYMVAICAFCFLAGCTKQTSSEPSQTSPSHNAGNPSNENKGNSDELGPGADKEQTMPDVVK